MHFKDWCSAVFGIANFSEGKTVSRVFIPLLSNKIDLNFVAQNRGYFTTVNNVHGLVIPSENYNNLIFHLLSEYRQYNSINNKNDKDDFQIYRNSYFFAFGLDSRRVKRHQEVSNIHVTLNDETQNLGFQSYFNKYNPQLGFDALTYSNIIEMPPNFLNDLYRSYYKSPFAEIKNSTDLDNLHAQESCLKKLLQHVSQNYFALNSAKRLSLDYDNNGPLALSTSECCSAYALSLKVFAEIHRDNLLPLHYNQLQIASALIETYDEQGHLRQSLKTDVEFILYLKNLYEKSTRETPYDFSKGLPLLADVASSSHVNFSQLIQNNTHDLLEGNSSAVLDHNTTFASLRFLPDSQKCSDTDEIILRGGSKKNHFALVRLIKVGILETGQLAKPNDIAHHYDYFKVENNLGFGSQNLDRGTKTCWGTYVTKLIPSAYTTDSQPILLSIDPYQDPQRYQSGMEITLRELIRVEREILFYREQETTKGNGAPKGSKEAKEWRRLSDLRQLLSGSPFSLPIEYIIQDPIDPTIRYICAAYNQRGFYQEGGSCPTFSLKSWVDNFLGHELTSLHNIFIQQNDAQGHSTALQHALTRVQQRISELEPPLEIRSSTREIYTWIKAFKKYLGVTSHIDKLTLDKSVPKQPFIRITDSTLKKQWIEFFTQYNEKKNAKKENTHFRNSNYFFNRSLEPGSVRILKRSENAAPFFSRRETKIKKSTSNCVTPSIN